MRGTIMNLNGQRVIPAARNAKDFELLMKSPHSVIILLNTHVAQVQGLLHLAKQHHKQVILHADLIQGLKHDEAGAQFLCQMVKPTGLISTHTSVIAVAKKHQLIAVQRIFLLDSNALETSYRVLQSSQPNYIEVLPGVLPNIIAEIRDQLKIPILAGGFIRTKEEMDQILQAGATAITTSTHELWKYM